MFRKIGYWVDSFAPDKNREAFENRAKTVKLEYGGIYKQIPRIT